MRLVDLTKVQKGSSLNIVCVEDDEGKVFRKRAFAVPRSTGDNVDYIKHNITFPNLCEGQVSWKLFEFI